MEEKKKQNKNRLRAEIGNVLKNLLAFKQFLLLSKQVIESGIEINLAVKRYAIESNRIQWKWKEWNWIESNSIWREGRKTRENAKVM